MIQRDYENQESPVLDDSILKAMYIKNKTPCDRLVSDPKRLLAFTQAYMDLTGQKIEPDDLAHRLLTLRKQGEAKGGLPRLSRACRSENRHA